MLFLAAAAQTVPDGQVNAADLLPGRYLRLSVSDTGTGMDAATLARASEPFFTTKPLGKGTGLGLAMARGFAEQSGGGFAIESVAGMGTTVTLWFPAAAGAPDTAGRVPSELPAPCRPGACVMVVDDDAMVREVLVSEMTGLGYRVSQACDGLQALAQIDDGAAVDLLISDFAMPGMNGLTLIQEVRRRRPALPALLLTGYADADMRFAAGDADAGATAWLQKPVSCAALAQGAATLLAHDGSLGPQAPPGC